jgi:hypothetical protein
MDLNTFPKWAIVFGGLRYFIVLIVYIKDLGDEVRPALYCSDICSIHHRNFPICSTVLSMTLTAELSQMELLERLMVPVPAAPAALPTSRLDQHLAATASQVRRVSLIAHCLWSMRR